MEDENLEVNGRGEGSAEQHHIQVARVLLERLQDVIDGKDDGDPVLTEILGMAASEFGVEEVNDGQSKKRGTEPREIMGSKRAKEGCEHSCTYNNEVINPRVWGNLPPDLLRIVFSHLLVDRISGLQLLDKHWKQTVSADSNFHDTCSEVYPKMVGFMTRDHNTHLFYVRVLDLNYSKWFTYKISVGRPDVDFNEVPNPVMFSPCEDGGLVCFVTVHLSIVSSEAKKKKARSSLFLVD